MFAAPARKVEKLVALQESINATRSELVFVTRSLAMLQQRVLSACTRHCPYSKQRKRRKQMPRHVAKTNAGFFRIEEGRWPYCCLCISWALLTSKTRSARRKSCATASG